MCRKVALLVTLLLLLFYNIDLVSYNVSGRNDNARVGKVTFEK